MDPFKDASITAHSRRKAVILAIIVIVVLAALGGFLYSRIQQAKSSDSSGQKAAEQLPEAKNLDPVFKDNPPTKAPQPTTLRAGKP